MKKTLEGGGSRGRHLCSGRWRNALTQTLVAREESTKNEKDQELRKREKLRGGRGPDETRSGKEGGEGNRDELIKQKRKEYNWQSVLRPKPKRGAKVGTTE